MQDVGYVNLRSQQFFQNFDYNQRRLVIKLLSSVELVGLNYKHIYCDIITNNLLRFNEN